MKKSTIGNLTSIYHCDILIAMKRTTIWLHETDKNAIRAIKSKYGLSTDSAAIRLAVRILACQGLKISNDSLQIAQDTPRCNTRD